jgi:hypothetical protein
LELAECQSFLAFVEQGARYSKIGPFAGIINRYDGQSKFVFIMSDSEISKKHYVYQSPVIFVGIFFGILIVWTVICLLLIGSIEFSWGWPLVRIFMVAFIMVYTWYFSLAISYKISITADGDIELTSFRRVIRVHAEEIGMVEGPKWALITYGFIRFRLAREKAYLYSGTTDKEIQKILKIMREVNEDIVFKGL